MADLVPDDAEKTEEKHELVPEEKKEHVAGPLFSPSRVGFGGAGRGRIRDLSFEFMDALRHRVYKADKSGELIEQPKGFFNPNEAKIQQMRQRQREEQEMLRKRVVEGVKTPKRPSPGGGTPKNVLYGKARKEFLERQKQLEKDKIAAANKGMTLEEYYKYQVYLTNKEIMETKLGRKLSLTEDYDLRFPIEEEKPSPRFGASPRFGMEKPPEEKMEMEEKPPEDITMMDISGRTESFLEEPLTDESVLNKASIRVAETDDEATSAFLGRSYFSDMIEEDLEIDDFEAALSPPKPPPSLIPLLRPGTGVHMMGAEEEEIKREEKKTEEEPVSFKLIRKTPPPPEPEEPPTKAPIPLPAPEEEPKIEEPPPEPPGPPIPKGTPPPPKTPPPGPIAHPIGTTPATIPVPIPTTPVPMGTATSSTHPAKGSKIPLTPPLGPSGPSGPPSVPSGPIGPRPRPKTGLGSRPSFGLGDLSYTSKTGLLSPSKKNLTPKSLAMSFLGVKGPTGPSTVPRSPIKGSLTVKRSALTTPSTGKISPLKGILTEEEEEEPIKITDITQQVLNRDYGLGFQLPSIRRRFGTLEGMIQSGSVSSPDVTIPAVPITLTEEATYKDNVTKNLIKKTKFKNLLIEAPNFSKITGLPMKVLPPPDELAMAIDPETLKEFLTDDHKYYKIINEFQSDAKTREFDRNLRNWEADPSTNAMVLGETVPAGWPGWSENFQPIRPYWNTLAGPVRIPQADIEKDRLRQLLGIMAAYNYKGDLPVAQKIIGTGPSFTAKEVEHFTDAEKKAIAYKQTLQTQDPYLVSKAALENPRSKKFSKATLDYLESLKQGALDDRVAYENGIINQQDYKDKIAFYAEGLDRLASVDGEYQKVFNYITQTRIPKQALIDWRLFNEHLKWIDEVTGSDPHNFASRKIQAQKEKVVQALKSGLDLTEAYDMLNGIVNKLKQIHTEINTERTNQGLEPLEHKEIMRRVAYDETKKQEPVQRIALSKNDLRNPVIMRKLTEELRDTRHVFAFPSLGLKKAGLPVLPGMRYIDHLTADKVKTHLEDGLHKEPIRFDFSQLDKSGKIHTGPVAWPLHAIIDGGDVKDTVGDDFKVDSLNSPKKIADAMGTLHSVMSLRKAIINHIDKNTPLAVREKIFKKPPKDMLHKGMKKEDREAVLKEYYASEIFQILVDLQNARQFVADAATNKDGGFPELKPEDARSIKQTLKTFREGQTGKVNVSPIKTGKFDKSGNEIVIPKTLTIAELKLRQKPEPRKATELTMDSELALGEREKARLQREAKFAEGNFKFAKSLTKEEPEINRAEYGDHHIEFDVKNEADLMRMKNEVNKMLGELFIIDLRSGRLFPIPISKAMIGNTYVFIKTGQPGGPSGKDKLRKKPWNYYGAVSAYYPTLQAIHRSERELFPYEFMRNGRDKMKQMSHLAAQKPYFNDYRDQARKAVGGGLWKQVRKSLQAGTKHAGNYIVNKTISAGKDLIEDTAYQGRRLVNQEKRAYNSIKNTNRNFYKDPTLYGLGNTINKTVLGGAKMIYSPLITSANTAANVSDFVSDVPVVGTAKSVAQYLVPPLGVANALVHGVRNVDEGRMYDAAINVGDALLGSGAIGKLNGSVELGARILNTGMKIADRFGVDKKHDEPPR